MRRATIPGLPALVLEELLHILVALPFVATIAISVSETPPLRFRWRQGTPRGWIYLTNLAPTLVGLLVAVTVGLTVPLPIHLVTTDPFLTGAAALYAIYNWLLFSWPSKADRNPFGGTQS